MNISDLKLRIRNGAGFTLVELLVVIAIIGIIGVVSLPNIMGFTEKGRDAKRKEDIKKIRTALEMYRTDKGVYPQTLPACGKELVFSISPTPILVASAVSDQSKTLLVQSCTVYYFEGQPCKLSQGKCCQAGLICTPQGSKSFCLAPTPTPTLPPPSCLIFLVQGEECNLSQGACCMSGLICTPQGSRSYCLPPPPTPTNTPTPLPTPTPTPLPPGYLRYLKETPCDPKTKQEYGYVPEPIGCTTDCSSYTLSVCLENKTAGLNIESVSSSECASEKKYVLENAK